MFLATDGGDTLVGEEGAVVRERSIGGDNRVPLSQSLYQWVILKGRAWKLLTVPDCPQFPSRPFQNDSQKRSMVLRTMLPSYFAGI